MLEEIYRDVHFLADAEDLMDVIQGDKKNKGDELRFTLITQIGNGVVDVPIAEEDIIEAMALTKILA